MTFLETLPEQTRRRSAHAWKHAKDGRWSGHGVLIFPFFVGCSSIFIRIFKRFMDIGYMNIDIIYIIYTYIYIYIYTYIYIYIIHIYIYIIHIYIFGEYG